MPRLRRFILDLAVRGRLVAQDRADEPAAELVRRIRAEQKNTTGRRSETRSADFPAIEEQSFDLPGGWLWVRFGDLAEFAAGRTPPRHDSIYWDGGEYNWASIADLNDGGLVSSTKEKVSQESKVAVFGTDPAPAGTVIMSFKLTIGKISRLAVPAFHNEAIISIRPHLPALEDYLFRILPQFARAGRTKDAIKGATLNRQSLASLVLPVPPLAEQQRIVAKVDELMALCDRLEVAQAEREARRETLISVHARCFRSHDDPQVVREGLTDVRGTLPRLTKTVDHVHELRQMIFSLAIRGALSTQADSDTPASKILGHIAETRRRLMAAKTIPRPKPLPSVNEIESPFDLKAGWSWAMLGHICYHVADGPHHSPTYVSARDGVPFLSTRNVRIGRFDLRNVKYISPRDFELFSRRIKPERGDIIYTKGGTTGIAKVNDLDFEFAVWVHLAVLRIEKQVLAPSYVAMALNSPFCYAQSQQLTQGTSNFDLGLTRMIKILLPIPPVEEQHRIFAKVDGLMAVCDRLEAQITAGEATSSRLLDALLHEALAGSQVPHLLEAR